VLASNHRPMGSVSGKVNGSVISWLEIPPRTEGTEIDARKKKENKTETEIKETNLRSQVTSCRSRQKSTPSPVSRVSRSHQKPKHQTGDMTMTGNLEPAARGLVGPCSFWLRLGGGSGQMCKLAAHRPKLR
jgi:hypothetical protein